MNDHVVSLSEVVQAYATRLCLEAERVHAETYSDGETDAHAHQRMNAVELHDTLELHYLAQFAPELFDKPQ